MLGSALLLASATVSHLSGHCTDIETALAQDVAGDRIVVPTDGEVYASSVQQYASSSMPNGTLHPSAVVYANTTLEVQRIVHYAKTCGFKISIRSGGHQYSGLSSCNSAEHKCIQVDLSSMSSVSVGETTAVVGPGASLLSLYKTLADHGLFIGGGECDTVAVGGHTQTGGAGIFARSFGLFADSVVAIEMVLASGRVLRVTKPSGDFQNFNDRLYWAVLSGNAGSWGVATSYELAFRRDADYPHSTYYFCAAEWTKDAYLQSARAISEMVASDEWPMDTAGDESAYISVATRQPFDSNIIHIEGYWSGVSGKAFDATHYNNFVAAVANTSAICRAFPIAPSAALRDFLVMGKEREYPFPYAMKTARGLEGAAGEDALEMIASTIDAAMSNPALGVYIVHQLSTFGGESNSAESRARSAVPYRSYPLISVFDSFHFSAVNPNAKATAIAANTALWDSLLTTDTFKRDRRTTWAMFGDLDIENAYQYYWDDATYLKLKGIKTMVDPHEMFRTSFTIPSLLRDQPR